MTAAPTLLARVRSLVAVASDTYAGRPAASATVTELAARLDEPLRIAIAGRVKSGKSTLANALVGEVLAASDTAECTRFVTWYRHGHVYRTLVRQRHGGQVAVPFRRDGGGVEPILDGLAPEAIEQLVVEWPSPVLRAMTLIDTPGLGSLTSALGARASTFLLPDDTTSPADAVVYLARHLHAADVRFLEAFRDDDAGRPDPINAIGVLARADEVGAGRVDAMEVAATVAERYRRDSQVRRLCQTVVPLAGLLALGASQLSEDDYRALGRLAGAADDHAEAVLLSTDRFGGRVGDIGISLDVRARLLDRFGLFGVRLARALIRRGAVRSAGELAGELRRQSGVDDLRDALATQFTARADVLKSRAALAALAQLLHTVPPGDGGRLASLSERVEAGAHELAEQRLLLALRAGVLELDDEELAEVDRLLGCSAGSPARLGLDGAVDAEVATKEIVTRVQRWQRRAEHPLAPSRLVDAARIVIRTYEGMLIEPGLTGLAGPATAPDRR
jgi:hypothetical protein